MTWLHRRTPTLVAFDVPRTVLLTAAGHKLRALKTPNGGMLTSGSASPNGRELLFVDGPDNSYESTIFVGNAVSGRVRPLTQRSSAAS